MRLSRHFTSEEFRCRHCGAVEVDAELVRRLELLRALVGRPLRIVSGFRCPTHNAAVGGARRSSHLAGEAADIEPGYATPAQARSVGFRGIGSRGAWAVHVDVRSGAVAAWTYD